MFRLSLLSLRLFYVTVGVLSTINAHEHGQNSPTSPNLKVSDEFSGDQEETVLLDLKNPPPKTQFIIRFDQSTEASAKIPSGKLHSSSGHAQSHTKFKPHPPHNENLHAVDHPKQDKYHERQNKLLHELQEANEELRSQLAADMKHNKEMERKIEMEENNNKLKERAMEIEENKQKLKEKAMQIEENKKKEKERAMEIEENKQKLKERAMQIEENKKEEKERQVQIAEENKQEEKERRIQMIEENKRKEKERKIQTDEYNKKLRVYQIQELEAEINGIIDSILEKGAILAEKIKRNPAKTSLGENNNDFQVGIEEVVLPSEDEDEESMIGDDNEERGPLPSSGMMRAFNPGPFHQEKELEEGEERILLRSLDVGHDKCHTTGPMTKNVP